MDWLKGTAVRWRFVSEADLNNVPLAKDVAEALDIIEQTKEAFESGGGDVCINSQIYKMTSKPGENNRDDFANVLN